MITRDEAAALVGQVPVRGAAVSKADLAATIVALYDERSSLEDALVATRLEIRRIRAAEDPGTDDEAVAPWVPDADFAFITGSFAWRHPTGVRLFRNHRMGWILMQPEPSWERLHPDPFVLAYDAMKAVP